jgi:hypothetical protein
MREARYARLVTGDVISDGDNGSAGGVWTNLSEARCSRIE